MAFIKESVSFFSYQEWIYFKNVIALNQIPQVFRLTLFSWCKNKNFNAIPQGFRLSLLNFFVNRSTNAAAEAFNAKIKAFRTSFRGVVDMSFFLFRLAKVYAWRELTKLNPPRITTEPDWAEKTLDPKNKKRDKSSDLPLFSLFLLDLNQGPSD